MTDRIKSVKAIRVAAQRDYQTTAGLRAASVSVAKGPTKALDRNSGRHLCVYPGSFETLLVRIEAESGLVGWGEAHSPPTPRVSKAVVEDLLAPQIIGDDPLSVEAIWDRLYNSMRLRGHDRGFMMEALAGVDIALWDLRGKILDVPVYRLLGGPFDQWQSKPLSLPCYASGVPGKSLDDRIAAADRFLGMGFTAIKLSIGRAPLGQDITQVEALAEHLGSSADLLVDAHGCYDARSVVPAARAMESAGVRWLEDPLPPEDVAGYGSLCAALDMPIANGETECTRWQFHAKLSAGAADIVLPDICRAGGITEAVRIAQVADLFGIPWCAHVSIGTWVHLVASLHVAAASPNFLICEYPNPLQTNPLGDALLSEPLRYESGTIRVPDGPGLGLIIDEDAVADRAVS